jgi:hypothetical protein
MINLSEFEKTFGNENAATLCRRLAGKLTDLKGRLQARYESHFPGQNSLIKSSIEEAEEIAWQTPFPHLFLPVLAEERIAFARSADAPTPVLARAA